MQRKLLSIGFTFLLLFAFSYKNIFAASDSKELELFIHFNRYQQYSSLSGARVNGKYLAFLGTRTGTSIIDVTEPGESKEGKEIAFIPGPTSSWREMKSYFDPKSGHTFLYIVTEGLSESFSGGLQIVDLSLPDGPALVKTDNLDFLTAHTISVDPLFARLFINGSYDGHPDEESFRDGENPYGTMKILDISDPLNPHQIGSYARAYVHDSYPAGDLCFVFEIYEGAFEILDISDLKNIKVLAKVITPQRFTHSGWPSEDGKFLFVADEVANNALLVYAISNFSDIKLGGSFKESVIPDRAILHNPMVKGRFVYCSWYTEGIRVIDIADPLQPFEAGYFDTYLGASGGFSGCWGIYVDERGYVYGSDMYNRPEFLSGGLFIVKFPD